MRHVGELFKIVIGVTGGKLVVEGGRWGVAVGALGQFKWGIVTFAFSPLHSPLSKTTFTSPIKQRENSNLNIVLVKSITNPILAAVFTTQLRRLDCMTFLANF
jgi:hypothetical protein